MAEYELTPDGYDDEQGDGQEEQDSPPSKLRGIISDQASRIRELEEALGQQAAMTREQALAAQFDRLGHWLFEYVGKHKKRTSKFAIPIPRRARLLGPLTPYPEVVKARTRCQGSQMATRSPTRRTAHRWGCAGEGRQETRHETCSHRHDLVP